MAKPQPKSQALVPVGNQAPAAQPQAVPPSPPGQTPAQDGGAVNLDNVSGEQKKSGFKNPFKKQSEISQKPLKKVAKGKRIEAPEDMKITTIPKIKEPGWEEVEVYPVHEPYSYIRIKVYSKTREYVYEAFEPPLTKMETKIFEFLKSEIIKKVSYFKDDVEEVDENKRRLRSLMKDILVKSGKKINDVQFEKLYYYIFAEFIAYGRITIMMEDPSLEDVSCDGTGIPIYVFHRKFKNIKTNVIYYDKEELDMFAIRLAQRSGKHISIANPVLDATLPDGSRLNETFGNIVTTRGTSFTIRKFKEDPLTISDLVGWKTLSKEMAAHLWLAVQYGESMLVSGGTASGKTTTLNAISHFIPPSAKVITIEDTREMQLPHENWIAGLTRESKGESGSMQIDMYALLIAALRQRPEYMIVGEVRGKETMAVFQAMATGQTTYASIHADSVAAIIHRLENPPISIPRILILGLNLVLLQAQVKVKNRRTRRIKELAEIIGIEPTTNEIITNSIFKWIPARDEFRYSGHSKLYEKIMDRENMTAEEVMQEVKQRTDVIDWFVKKEIRTHTEVATIVNEYYRQPKVVVERCRRELEELRTKAVMAD